MNETIILWSQGGLTLTAWGLCLALGAAAAVLLTVLLGRKRIGADAALSLCLCVIPGAVIGGRIVYVLTMLQSIIYDLGGWLFIPQLWQGGFTLWGAALGGGIAAWIYARSTGRKVCELLNLLAPGAALTLCVCRLAEVFTSQGLGMYMESEALMRFPFAVQSVYGDWQTPVFLFESLAAWAIMLVMLRLFLRGGRSAEVFVILLALSQILLESWREDEFIRFGFVRFNQLASALALGGVMALQFRRSLKHGWRKEHTLRVIVFALGIAVVIAVEFALDKSDISNALLYCVMTAALIAMGGAFLIPSRTPDA